MIERGMKGLTSPRRVSLLPFRLLRNLCVSAVQPSLPPSPSTSQPGTMAAVRLFILAVTERDFPCPNSFHFHLDSGGEPPGPRTRSRGATSTAIRGCWNTCPASPFVESFRRRVRSLSPLPAGHRPDRRARLQHLSLFDRVGAYRAGRGRILDRRARPLPADAGRLPRASPDARSSPTTTSRRRAGSRRKAAGRSWTTRELFARYCEKAPPRTWAI